VTEPRGSEAALDAARAELRLLEEPIVAALLERARFRLNASPAPGGLARVYAEEILPFLCAPGHDGRGQESAALDERLLCLLAERVALGEKIARAKAAAHPELAGRVKTGGRDALLAALTNPEVERLVIARVRGIAERAAVASEAGLVAEVFRRWIIPLTKDREADTLSGAPRP
jgi:chorismate mutase